MKHSELGYRANQFVESAMHWDWRAEKVVVSEYVYREHRNIVGFVLWAE